MNAIEIEEAISILNRNPFDPDEFPYSFLEAYGNKPTTIKRLRKGDSNNSDLNGVLQRKNIHISISKNDQVTQTLKKLKESPETKKAKARFILSTDGNTFEAEDLFNGEIISCKYCDFANYFAFFLPLAGINITKEIQENAFDIRATSRLNKLYIELLNQNPKWSENNLRAEMNTFMTRLIFCFFAEDTDIFGAQISFTKTIEQISSTDATNTNVIISQIFKVMNIPKELRENETIPKWALDFPYVNGGLFSGNIDVPKFSKIARSYLIHIGNLDWQKINPDIFGSMIQAVADDDERATLGMHYTSISNILKVLNPLLLDDLREKLTKAENNPSKLLNLRKRLSKIRIFDPACGSGNFLVIAYKEMRKIEFEINKRRRESENRSVIPLTNFRGIEVRNFSAEVARLALIIAEFQCNAQYRGQKEALNEFLPLNNKNWITCGNALKLDWLSICPPQISKIENTYQENLLTPSYSQSNIDFINNDGETYICGNPPYLGSKWQAAAQKNDLKGVFDKRVKGWKSLDYVSGWLLKAADYSKDSNSKCAFVLTNSICQGLQVPVLWPHIFKCGVKINFAHTSFKWSNLASHNAGVTVVIVGLSPEKVGKAKLYTNEKNDSFQFRTVDNINAYLVPGKNIFVDAMQKPIDERAQMRFGNHFYYAKDLIMSRAEANLLIDQDKSCLPFIKKFYGAKEVISGVPRACIWVKDNEFFNAKKIDSLSKRFNKVAEARRGAKNDKAAHALAYKPYRFRDQFIAESHLLAMPAISSENRPYMPVDLLDKNCILGHKSYVLYDAPLWNFALIASRLHWVWISTVCGRLGMSFSYSNTLGWNTFPVPKLTTKNKLDMTKATEEILIAREQHYPKSIADLYEPDSMPADLVAAHNKNDEILESIYIGRRFKNDSERLEMLFNLYTKANSIEISI